MNKFSFFPFVISMCFLSLGIFVLTRSKSNKDAAVGFFISSLATFWWQFTWTFLFNARDASGACLLAKVGHIGIALLPATLVHYYAFFYDRAKNYRLVIVFYFVAAFFIGLLTTNLFISGVYRFYWGYYPKAGLLHPLFLCYLLLGVVVCGYFLIQKGRQVNWAGVAGEQVKFLCLAFAVYCLAAMDFLVNYGVEFYPFGVFAILVSLCISSYAIVKYRLMDIRVAVASTAIFLSVYVIALGVPFYVYQQGHHFPALLLAILLATAAPFIYGRLRSEAEAKILKVELDQQKALTLTVQQQLIESEKMAAVGYLVGGLAHQLKNRFSSLIFLSDFASRKVEQNRKGFGAGADYDETQGYLKKITEAVHASKDVVNGVLNYASDRETMTEIDLSKLVAASIELIEFKIQPGSVIFENNIDQNTPKVQGNFAQLQEVLFNIIDNAYYSMMEKKAQGSDPAYQPRMTFTAKASTDMVELTVTDNGLGIKEEHMRKLFTPLFSTKTKDRKGHGLGLYVMKQIVEKNHGGKIEFASQYGEGVTVHVSLPV